MKALNKKRDEKRGETKRYEGLNGQEKSETAVLLFQQNYARNDVMSPLSFSEEQFQECSILNIQLSARRGSASSVL